jgi:hypothetical protein
VRILDIRPPAFQGEGRFRELARFDAQITDEIRLFRMRLLETPEGRRLVYSPSNGGQRFASFAPALADKLTAAASAAYEKMERENTNERIRAA